jgi:hypothetical protein
MRALVASALLGAGLAVAAPAVADDTRVTPALPNMEQALRGMVGERDVSLLFDFLRESLTAAIEGREPPPVPEELTGRAEALGQALKAQGALVALALLATLEQRAKEALREPRPRRPAVPPAPSSTPL